MSKTNHDLIPRIVRECISKSNFSPPNGATLTQVMHVYDWTDRCIHRMSTDFVWIVWKAFMVCDDFFTPTPRNNGMMSIHDSFELSNKLLEEMRRSFVERVGQYNSKIKEFAVSWGTPEAAIVDDKGRWCKVNPSNEVVINKYFMTKSEGACL